MAKPQLLSTIVYQEMNKKQTPKNKPIIMFLAAVYVNFRFDLC